MKYTVWQCSLGWCVLDQDGNNIGPRFPEKPGAVFGSEEQARQLCNKLNNV